MNRVYVKFHRIKNYTIISWNHQLHRVGRHTNYIEALSSRIKKYSTAYLIRNSVIPDPLELPEMVYQIEEVS